ncbi:hypothetical protein TNCV_184221 [Trichonephila clavipes]|nr:hypothetical protein TNCV_184221 [Trichonephila clavipes]
MLSHSINFLDEYIRLSEVRSFPSTTVHKIIPKTLECNKRTFKVSAKDFLIPPFSPSLPQKTVETRKRKEKREREREEPGPGWRKGKCPALDGEKHERRALVGTDGKRTLKKRA